MGSINITHVLHSMAEATTADPVSESIAVKETTQDEAMDGKIDSTVGDSSEQEPGEEKDTPTDSLKQSEATDAPRNDTSVAPAVSTESAKQSGGTETPSISTLEEKIIRQIEVSNCFRENVYYVCF